MESWSSNAPQNGVHHFCCKMVFCWFSSFSGAGTRPHGWVWVKGRGTASLSGGQLFDWLLSIAKLLSGTEVLLAPSLPSVSMSSITLRALKHFPRASYSWMKHVPRWRSQPKMFCLCPGAMLPPCVNAAVLGTCPEPVPGAICTKNLTSELFGGWKRSSQPHSQSPWV